MQGKELAAIIEQAKQGNPEAFEALFNEFKNTAYGIGLRLLRSESDAEDIVQETAIQVYRFLDSQKDPSAFFGWVKQIAVNLCKKKLRKNTEVLFAQQEEDAPVDLADEREDSRPDEVADTQETRRIVAKMIESLPEDQRVCVHLFYAQEMPVDQIAELLGVSANTVKSRLFYARKKIGAQAVAYKEQGTPLYALAPVWLLRLVLSESYAGLRLPQAASAKIAASLQNTLFGPQSGTPDLRKAGQAAEGGKTAANAASASAAAGSGAAGGGLVAKVAALPMVVKIVAGVAALILIVGGIAAEFLLFNGGKEENLPSSIVDGGSDLTSEDILGSWSMIEKITYTGDVNGKEYSFSDPEGRWANLIFYQDGSYIFTYTTNAVGYTDRMIEARGSYTVDGNKLLISNPTELDNQFWQAVLYGGTVNVSEIGFRLEDGMLKLVLESLEDPSKKLGADFKSDSQIVTAGDGAEQTEKDLSELLQIASKLQEGEIIDVTDEWLDVWCSRYAGYWNIIERTGLGDFLGGVLRQNRFFQIYQEQNEWYYFDAAYGTGESSPGVIKNMSLTLKEGKPAILLQVEYEEHDFGGSYSPAYVADFHFCIGPAYNAEEPMMRQIYLWDNYTNHGYPTHGFYYAGETFDEAYEAYKEFTGMPF